MSSLVICDGSGSRKLTDFSGFLVVTAVLVVLARPSLNVTLGGGKEECHAFLFLPGF